MVCPWHTLGELRRSQFRVLGVALAVDNAEQRRLVRRLRGEMLALEGVRRTDAVTWTRLAVTADGSTGGYPSHARTKRHKPLAAKSQRATTSAQPHTHTQTDISPLLQNPNVQPPQHSHTRTAQQTLVWAMHTVRPPPLTPTPCPHCPATHTVRSPLLQRCLRTKPKHTPYGTHILSVDQKPLCRSPMHCPELSQHLHRQNPRAAKP